jgi:hypothetical protein
MTEKRKSHNRDLASTLRWHRLRAVEQTEMPRSVRQRHDLPLAGTMAPVPELDMSHGNNWCGY